MKMIDSMGQNNQKASVCEDARLFTNKEKTYTSADLLGESSSVFIDHRGAIYTLRLTQFGKLILTK